MFQFPLMNAAGVFKNGEGYEVVSRQGAGGFVVGTTTMNARQGNYEQGILNPFVPLPKSRGAINFLGLPNLWDEIVSDQVCQIQKKGGRPVIVSVMAAPGKSFDIALEGVVNAMFWRRCSRDKHVLS